MEKIKKSEIKIGPDIHLGHIDEIQTHSSFICFRCKKKVRDKKEKKGIFWMPCKYFCFSELHLVDYIQSLQLFLWISKGHLLLLYISIN